MNKSIPSNQKILVFIPTYNERDNIPLLYDAIKKLPHQCDILFCDDKSPDGTGAAIEKLREKDTSVHVIHRSGKLGTGTAFIEGYKFARAHHYDLFIGMDADLTHDPAYIPSMLSTMQAHNADIVIGSRYANGGRMTGWNSIRLPLTYFWRNMIKFGLGMPFDATGAFRAYRVHLFEDQLLRTLKSRGFSFQMESIFRLKQHGAHIVEIPIHAKSRIHGESKLNTNIMREVAAMYFRLLGNRIIGKKS